MPTQGFCQDIWGKLTDSMFCEKCGADNSDAARFCRKCGEPVSGEQLEVSINTDDAEEETRVAIRSPMSNVQDPMPGDQKPIEGADENEIFSIGPTLVFVKMGYVASAIGGIILVALLSLVLGQYVPIWLSVLLGLMLFLIPAYYHFQRKLVRYTLTDSALQIDSGFLARTTRSVPVSRIQDVTVSATPWQRLLGIGDLIFDNASEQGGKLTLANINSPKKRADALLEQMRRLEK